MLILHLAGLLGKDPVVRFTPSGQKVTNFNVAVNQRKGKEEVTVWVRVTVWGDRFDKIISFLKKGSGVVVVGRLLAPTLYNGKDGPQISLEVNAEMLEFSPFGRTDRSSEGNGSSLNISMNDPMLRPSQGGGEGRPSFASPLPGKGAPFPRGSNEEEGMTEEDEGLPF